MARNLTITGIPKLEARIRDLVGRMTDDKAKAAGMTVAQIVSDATDLAEKEVESRARAARVPRDVMEDVFTYKRNRPQDKGKRTMLIGIRKRGRQIGNGIQNTSGVKRGVRKWAGHAYREWYPGRQTGKWEKTQRSKRKGQSLVMPGFRNDKGQLQLIGESLAEMWERGTTKMRPRKFFSPAISAVRGRVEETIKTGLTRLLSDIERAA